MTVPGYVEQGKGEPLLLLMGLGADGRTWQPHMDVWASQFRCLAVDNRGTGSTPVGEAVPTTKDLADDAAALIEALGIGPVRVAGISMGACIAQELALSQPGLVRKAVLVAPWARVDPSTASILDTLGRARLSGDVRLFNTLLRNTIWTPEWVNSHAEEMATDLDAPFAMSERGFLHQVSACTTHDALDRIGGIGNPTLVTWGARDTFIRADLAAEVAAAIPGARTMVFATGHVHHWEELARFNEEVGEWLA